jgi:hypothetical protein
MNKTFFDKYYWELYNTVNLMNKQAKDGDLLRNRTNYGRASTIAQFLREFGHEVDLRVYGNGDYLVSDCIVVDGKELTMKAEKE